MAVVATVALLLGAQLLGSGSGRSLLGARAPEIAGTRLDGQPFALSDLRGRPVVLNFWASWCIPCRDEFPLFRDRLAAGGADAFVLVGVLFDDEPASARRFIDRFGATWPTVLDPDGEAARAYRLIVPPTTFFIDRDGVIRDFALGELRAADLEAKLETILP